MSHGKELEMSQHGKTRLKVVLRQLWVPGVSGMLCPHGKTRLKVVLRQLWVPGVSGMLCPHE